MESWWEGTDGRDLLYTRVGRKVIGYTLGGYKGNHGGRGPVYYTLPRVGIKGIMVGGDR